MNPGSCSTGLPVILHIGNKDWVIKRKEGRKFLWGYLVRYQRNCNWQSGGYHQNLCIHISDPQ